MISFAQAQAAEIDALQAEVAQLKEALRVAEIVRDDGVKHSNRYLEAKRASQRALRAALACWCPNGNPGGDGADGETYRLALKALEL